MLVASAIVPTFNGGQPLAATVDTTGTALSRPSAIAVQGDGKVVVVGTNEVPGAFDVTSTTTLYAARYNADGTPDLTFGTGGRVTLPLPVATGVASSTATGISLVNVLPAQDVLIQKDGKIVLDANIFVKSKQYGVTNPAVTASSQSVVYRLTSTGTLDTTFGVSGGVTLAAGQPFYDRLTLQTDGRIVLAGSDVMTVTSAGTTSETIVTRLNTDGTPDGSFNNGESVVLGTTPGDPVSFPRVLALRALDSGLIKVVSTTGDYGRGYLVDQLTSTGALDPGFGTNGAVASPASETSPITAAAVTPSGQVVIVPTRFADTRTVLIRLTANGTVDPSFAQSTPYYVTNVAAASDGSIILGNNSFQFERLRADGTPDPAFGPNGIAQFAVPDLSSTLTSNGNPVQRYPTLTAIVPQANGQIAVAGLVDYDTNGNDPYFKFTSLGAQAVVGLLRPTGSGLPIASDYDGDRRSDLAAALTQLGAFATRTAQGDTVQPFGTADAIPAPGDYDGDGKIDVAAYLPEYGVLAYRPSTGGADVLVRFGPTGAGNAIPAPGDYDGDGKTDVALYLPTAGAFVIDPSSGAAPYAAAFGSAGAGASVPAPGDYDGDGRTDLALYLPASGAFAIVPSRNGIPYAVAFGSPGAGNTLPAPGDYDGDGTTDLAAYLPQYGVYAYRASSGTGDVVTPFGPPGLGNAIPVPGDYDGDGRTDLALFLPASATYAIDPTGGGAPYAQQFGIGGAGNTTPATVVVTPRSTVSAMSLAAQAPDASANVPVYLINDPPGTLPRKKSST